MYDMARFSLPMMVACGATLRNIGRDARTMEEVAERIVRHLYDGLIDEATGERALVLARLFKTHDFSDLDPQQQQVVRAKHGNPAPDPEMKCLCLLATAGRAESWNRRTDSRTHQVIPLRSVDAVAEIPMISRLIRQFGIEVANVLDPGPEFLRDAEQATHNVFFVEDAAGSPYLPAQADFVIPYGVKSTLGLGGVLPSGNLFACILFSRIPLTAEVADMFKPLSLAMKVPLLPFEGAVFANAH